MEGTSTKQVGLRFGLIATLVLIAVTLIGQILGPEVGRYFSWISYLVLAVVIFFANDAFLKSGDGFISFGQSFTIGTIVSLIGSLGNSVFYYIYITIIDSSVAELVKEEAYRQMEESGQSDAEIEQAMDLMSFFFSPVFLTLAVFIALLIAGLIISLIIAAIKKKNNPNLEI